MRTPFSRSLLALLLLLGFLTETAALASSWPMRGKDNTRNAVSLERGAPIQWQLATKKTPSTNIHWSVPLGTFNLGEPVLADGLLWIGTNNDPPRDPANKQDASVLQCFRASDGKFLYQYLSRRMAEGNRLDWPSTGLASSPLVEADWLWFCNNRFEVICLDLRPLHRGAGEPKVRWKVDLIESLGVQPRAVMIGGSGIHCSVTSHGELIYVNTMNARQHFPVWGVTAPDAPSLVCLEKSTGRVVWQDNSPGGDILDVQHGSPLVFEIDGQAQVVMGQGDGWLRSFDARTGAFLWKFDINLKASYVAEPRWQAMGYFVTTPVFHDGKVFIAAGRQMEMCVGPGRLVCVDPRKRGDISSELEVGPGKGKPNPNSGLLWEFGGEGEEKMQLTMSSVAVHKGMVIAPDFRGQIHCLDEATGKLHWTHNAKAHIYSSPLIADDKVYVGTEDGTMLILELGATKRLIAQHEFHAPIYAPPIYADGVLYIAPSENLYAITNVNRELSQSREDSHVRLEEINRRVLAEAFQYFRNHLAGAETNEFRCLWLADSMTAQMMTLDLRNNGAQMVRDKYTFPKRNSESRKLSELQVTSLQNLKKELPPSPTYVDPLRRVSIAFWHNGEYKLLEYDRAKLPPVMQRIYDMGGGYFPER